MHIPTLQTCDFIKVVLDELLENITSKGWEDALVSSGNLSTFVTL